MKKQKRGLFEAIGCPSKARRNHCLIRRPRCHPNYLKDLVKETCGSITLLRSEQIWHTISRQYLLVMRYMVSKVRLEALIERDMSSKWHALICNARIQRVEEDN